MPVTIHLKDGGQIKAVDIDGAGVSMVGEDAGRYECFVESLDGGTSILFQDQIEKVIDADGNEVEFGNPHFPGHPAYGTEAELLPSLKHLGEWFAWAAEELPKVTDDSALSEDDPFPNKDEKRLSILRAAVSQIDALEDCVVRLADHYELTEPLAQTLQTDESADLPIVEVMEEFPGGEQQ